MGGYDWKKWREEQNQKGGPNATDAKPPPPPPKASPPVFTEHDLNPKPKRKRKEPTPSEPID